MDDESQAVLCGNLEREGADTSFMDVCTAVELRPVCGYCGSLVCSQHDTTIGAQIDVCESDLECVTIWFDVLFQLFFGVVDLKILVHERN
uniref:Uncharacterized protein n=1 Tax=Aegilops tauschii TaxID=37682 RepID=M8C1T4_AEGTA